MGGISLKVYPIMGGHILNTSNSIPALINPRIRFHQILQKNCKGELFEKKN